MDTQEKEKKSEEIAAQTTQTKEQPVPAQPSYAELKKEKAKCRIVKLMQFILQSVPSERIYCILSF